MANIIKESLLQLHSPSAAELGRYGKAPVDYFTGVPSIVVPLTSVHAKGYELPVELRYHAGGNRPEQHPGWVGLGWSLHAGGCINRIINGMKDEMSREEYGDTKGIAPGADPGYLYHIEEVQTSDWTDDEALQGAYATYKDYSPDEYQICAGELNASFYIVGEKEIRIVSQNESSFTLEDVVISEDTSETGYDMYPGQCAQPIRARRYKYISCFMVRDKEGNRYVFGGDDSAIEYSVVQHPNLVEYSDGTVVNSNAWRAAATANTWLLSRIEKPDGEIISFTYEKNGVPVVVRDIHHGESYRVGASPAISGLYDTASTAANIKQNLNYTFLLPSYLKRISCRLSGDYLEFVTGDTTELRYGIVESDFNLNVANLKAVLTDGPFEFADFMRNSRYRKLVGITGYGRNISLEYTDDADTRLKLLSVKFRSTDGAEDHRYEFGYDPAPLPGYNSRMTDLWGYYNGNDFSRTVGGFGHGLDSVRVPVESKMRAEILTSVRYPTGGRTEYEYEAHRYSKKASVYPFAVETCAVDGMAGGLRIKSMTDYASDGKPETRVFDYTEGGRSSGILSGQVENYVSGTETGYLGGTKPVTIDFAMYSECPILPMSDTDGCHVTYGTVKETFADGGYSVMKHLNHDTAGGADSAPDNVYGLRTGCPLHPVFTSRGLSRGLLLSKEDFRSDGTPVRKESRSYLDACTERVKSVSDEQYLNGYIFFITYVRRPCGYPALASKRVTVYGDDGVGIVDDYTFTYNSVRLPVSRKHARGGLADGEMLFYPEDREGKVYSEMLSAGMHGVPVGKVALRDGKVIYGEEVEFKRIEISMPSGTRPAYVPLRTYSSKLASPVELSSYASSPMPYMDSVPDAVCRGYDVFANPLSVGFRDGSAVEYHWSPDHMNPSLAVRLRDREVHDRIVHGQLDSAVGDNPTLIKKFRTTEEATQVTCQVNAYYGFDLLYMVTVDGVSYFILGSCNPDMPDSRWQGYRDSYGMSVTVNVPAGDHVLSIQYSAVRIANAAQGKKYGYVSYAYHEESQLQRRTLLRDFEEEVEPGAGFHSEHGHAGRFNAGLSTAESGSVLDYMLFKSGSWHYRRCGYSPGTAVSIGEADGLVDNLRIFPSESLTESFTWYPSFRMRSRTDGRGVTESYSYDTLGRLTDVRDNGDRLVSSNQYHYQDASRVGSHILHREYTDGDGQTSRDSFQYYDGLGRHLQDVVTDGGGTGWDIVTDREYDGCGRELRSWLPVPVQSGSSRSPGAYSTRQQILTGGDGVYPVSDARRYMELIHEASPLERITEKYGAGEAWHAAGKRVSEGFLSNSGDAASELYYRGFNAVWSGGVLSLSRVPASALGSVQVLRKEDEDGRVMLEFTDGQGEKVMVRRIIGAGKCDTHYVYDAFGRLTVVLPPSLTERLESSGLSAWRESDMADLAYLYRYDSRGNCIARLLPGAGWIYQVYDRGGRLVLSQDAVMRQEGKWRFMLQDVFGRGCLDGVAELSVDAFPDPFGDAAVFVSMPEAPDYGSPLLGYELNGFSLNGPIEVLNVNYYDGYGFVGEGVFPAEGAAYDVTAETEYTAMYPMSASGLLTGTLAKVIGGSGEGGMLWSVMFYDERKRVVQKKSSAHLGGVDSEYLKYDFTGNVVGRKLIHRLASGAVVEERYTHTYDAMGRPLETSHKVDDAPWRTVSSLAYDHIGRTISERRNGVSALKSGFTYNLRSWLTGISGTLFSEVLRYQDGPAPQWGGMLSEMEWRSGADGFFRKYSFVYDGLSRLMSAEYGGDEVAGAFSESYTYDRNGNLTSLHRHGLNAHGAEKATLVSVSPSYSGNRLSAIGDAVFSYDAKGRQTASSYGGNSGTSYNVLDLPLRMTLPGGISIDYAYSADGRKLMEKVSGVSAAVTRDYCGTLLYEGGALKKIFFGGGYVDMGGQSPSYHFFLCDHLGSVRAVASEDGMVEQVSHYYPFGSRFSDPRTASSSSDNRMLFTGKELGAENGLYDFSARFLDPLLGRFTTMDPLAEKCPDISPYAYCGGDPVNALDPDGRNPIYSPCGVFLGTDDFGLQGNPLIMSKSKFMQGMLHAEAEKCSSKTMVSPFAVKMMLTHFKTLKDRPDYDGYVTIIEGIRWAKEHTGAKDSPTPDNTLYVDASKLDFGTISITDLRGEGVISPVDMFNEGNRKESVFNGRLRSTVYALGRINLILLNKDELTVKVVNDEAAVYDWNYGGSKIRNTALRINNFIFGIDPKIHGFNVYYYGVGKLNE